MKNSGKDIDVWKGLSILGLTFNHLVLWPCLSLSGALKFTYQSLGWFSFASVFFASAGYQWGRRAEKSEQLIRWNLLRASKLFGWVVLAVLIFQIGLSFGLIRAAPWQAHVNWRQPNTLILAVLGQRLPWLVDVIWMHAVLAVFSTVLWTLPWLRESSFRIASVSFAVWICSQWGLFNWEFVQQHTPSWHAWTSWQLLFVGSALMQRRDVSGLLQFIRRTDIKLILMVCAICFFILRHGPWTRDFNHAYMTQSFSFLFALNTVVLCILAAGIRFGQRLDYLAVIGRNSLLHYSLQCLVVYLLGGSLVLSPKQRIESVFVVIFVLGLLLIVGRFLFRRRLYEASCNPENESCHHGNGSG